jgi:hypothetical protein
LLLALTIGVPVTTAGAPGALACGGVIATVLDYAGSRTHVRTHWISGNAVHVLNAANLPPEHRRCWLQPADIVERAIYAHADELSRLDLPGKPLTLRSTLPGDEAIWTAFSVCMVRGVFTYVAFHDVEDRFLRRGGPRRLRRKHRFVLRRNAARMASMWPQG